MKTATHYTDLPAELHRQTLYDWGQRELREYHGPEAAIKLHYSI
jgi:hypothetical protein